MTLRILSLGAGVQSSVLAEMAADGDLAVDVAVFADTGWERTATYEHLVYLEGRLRAAGIELRQVSNGNIRSGSLSGVFNPIPALVANPDGTWGRGRRQCTKDYKLVPLYREIRKLVGLRPRQRSSGHLATVILGISFDEIGRMSDPRYPWIKNEYPLVDMRMERYDCLHWLRNHDRPIPERSACVGCPYKSVAEWVRMRDTSPAEWADAVAYEQEMQEHENRTGEGRTLFLHQGGPLSSIQSEEDRGQGVLFDDFDGCDGMCGL